MPRIQRFLERYRLPDGRRLKVYRNETDIAGRLGKRCPGGGWIGEPRPGLCISVGQAAESAPYYDPMGGGDAPLTRVVVNGNEGGLDFFWRRIDGQRRRDYGHVVHPSDDLPVTAQGEKIWLDFPEGPMTRGGLWQRGNLGQGWDRVPDISDVRSLRQTP